MWTLYHLELPGGFALENSEQNTMEAAFLLGATVSIIVDAVPRLFEFSVGFPLARSKLDTVQVE